MTEIQTPHNGHGERGVTGTTLAVVIFGFVFFGLFVGGYVILADRINGLDAYRVRELRDIGLEYKDKCEFNNAKLQELQAWVKQQPKLIPPAELLVIQQCIQPRKIEEEKEH